MKSNYKKLGQYIREINSKNFEGKEDDLLGVSTNKGFIRSIANTVGTDFRKYKIVKYHQFTYVPDTSRRGDRIGIALLEDYQEALVSSAYIVFEIINQKELLPEYLMMWFRRPEFDRYARFKSYGSVREMFDWEEMCNVELPFPDVKKQKAIVKEYNTIVNRIKLNEEFNKKLEETAQAIYKQWFVDFEFPDENKKSYKSSGGEMVFNEELGREIPVGWKGEHLNRLIEIKYGKDHKHLKDGIFPLYGSGGVMRYVEKPLYHEKSILIPRKGSLKNIMYIDLPFWSVDTMFYSKLRACYNGKYVYYFLKTIDMEALNTGSAVPSMTTSILNDLTLTIPPAKNLMHFEHLIETIFLNKNKKVLQIKELQKMLKLLLLKITKVKRYG